MDIPPSKGAGYLFISFCIQLNSRISITATIQLNAFFRGRIGGKFVRMFARESVSPVGRSLFEDRKVGKRFPSKVCSRGKSELGKRLPTPRYGINWKDGRKLEPWATRILGLFTSSDCLAEVPKAEAMFRLFRLYAGIDGKLWFFFYSSASRPTSYCIDWRTYGNAGY